MLAWGLFAIMIWQRRWTSDDGFINFRVVCNILAGHGPVFNVGERVEAFTSPLWIALLAGLAALGAGLGQAAAALGQVLAVMGVLLAQLGAVTVKSRVVCKSERKLLDASVRLPWRPPWARGVRGPGSGARSRPQ